MRAHARPSPRSYAWAAVAGAVPAFAVELALLLQGGPLLGYEPLGDVFDAQARSFLHGRWDVPADVIKIEGFQIGSHTYTYFGPVPALLRLPVVAFTDALDGRLTRVALIAAWALTLAMCARFAWRARRRLLGDEPVTRVEQAVVALWVFAAGAGSTVTYLTSRPSVFHEAIAWGVAITLVALDRVLAWSERRTVPRFAVALAFVTAALLTRASVGAAPGLALGFILLGDVIAGIRGRAPRKAVVAIALGLSLALPLAAYAGVNYAKFGSLFTVPYEHHRVTLAVQHRRDVLAANGGTIQGPQFLPTTAFHYVRPDALGLNGAFPWIDFPRPARVFGGVLMDQVDVASSVPSSMPALVVVAVGGVVAFVRRRELRGFVPLAAGAAACLVVTLAIGFVAHRYTADAIPLLVVAGGAAVPWLSRRRAVVAIAALAALAAASAAVTAALTIQFQQHYGFLTPPQLRAHLAAAQLDLPWGGEGPRVVRVAGELPSPVASDRTFAVVGDCDGLYRSDGTSWQPVEGTPATGHYRVRVTRGRGPVDLVAGITITWRGDALRVERGEAPTRQLTVAGESVVLDVVADPLVGFVDVRHDGELVLSDYYFASADEAPLQESERVELLASSTPVCEALTGRNS